MGGCSACMRCLTGCRSAMVSATIGAYGVLLEFVHAVTFVPGRARRIRAGYGMTTGRPRILIVPMADADLLKVASVGPFGHAMTRWRGATRYVLHVRTGDGVPTPSGVTVHNAPVFGQDRRRRARDGAYGKVRCGRRLAGGPA